MTGFVSVWPFVRTEGTVDCAVDVFGVDSCFLYNPMNFLNWVLRGDVNLSFVWRTI